ncbi:MAG: hypothetical protein Q4C50_13145 [Eubacteriales bacterium]|nr:hypothetical protein [Eubacteriales bacterium]
MEKPQIISLVNFEGKWVSQKELPQDIVYDMVGEAVKRAAKTIGFEADIPEKGHKKTASAGACSRDK